MGTLSDGTALRPISPDEYNRLAEFTVSVFLSDTHEDESEMERGVFEFDRSLAAFDGAEPVSSAAIFSRHMTVPGGPIPVAAVSWVAVAPTHRRQGLLTAMMRRQLHGLHDEGREAVAALWASEAAIYGRFGYGLASRSARATISTATAHVRPEVDLGSGRVEVCSREKALPALTSLYEAVRVSRVGHLDRPGSWWNNRLFDPERWRKGASSLRFALHRDEGGNPEAYAVFNVKSQWESSGPQGEASVREMVATTPAGYASIWRFLLGLDLVGQVTWDRAAPDEPLPHLVTNPRAVQQSMLDGLWIRLVDVDRALATRTYAVPVDLVLEVTDSFCPWNAGRYRLAGDPTGATCTRTEDAADLSTSSTALGAAYLGGTTLATLAAAGLVSERRAGALATASIAFAGLRQPNCLEIF
ncbi:MAG: GNAT family N-acetyltransferase [Actinomycetota bacterium]|nr:GNAT family N-acetyltransferase [Actinomycetota bacterium]